MYRRYRGYKWMSLRDVACYIAIAVVIVALFWVLNALGLHDNPKGEFTPADDTGAVVSAQYDEVSE